MRWWLGILALGAVLAGGCGGSSGGSSDGPDDTREAAALLESVDVIEQARLSGLEGRVDVLRDRFGIHHIYSRDVALDAAFVNGYLQARERLFQMDFLRKVSQGRLTELLGTLDSSVLSTSVFLRTVFTASDGGRIEDRLLDELRRVDPEALALVQRYCDGVNAYIGDLEAGRNGAVLPQQYKVIDGLYTLGSRYSIERWTPAHVLLLGRLQQFDLSNTLSAEMRRLERQTALDAAAARGDIPEGSASDILYLGPAFETSVLLGEEREPFGGPVAGRVAESATAVAPADEDEPPPPSRATVRRVIESIEQLQRVVPYLGEDRGSNNFIVSAGLSDSGVPLLANDPHLSLGNPSTFYFVHLDNKTFTGGKINAHGAGFPGLPGILLGQNDRLAWGGTVANFDVTDVYVEQVTEGTPRTVRFRGEQVPILRIEERFVIRELTGPPRTITIPIDIVPHHGPQVPDPDPTDDIVGLAAVDNMTVRWTGGEITRDILAFLGLMEAQGIDDFFEELLDFGVGAQNFVGADVDGNIAYFPHALIPLRQAGALSAEHPPWKPLPGTGGYEWLSDEDGRARFLPPERIPQARNPERGWLATANNDQLGVTFDADPLDDDTYLGWDYVAGSRANRIHERFDELVARGRVRFDDLVDIQNDHVSVYGRKLTPRLLRALDDAGATAGLAVSPETLAGVRSRLAAWSGDCPIGVDAPFSGTAPTRAEVDDSIGCTLFHAWASALPGRLLEDETDAAGIGAPSLRDTLKVLIHLLDDVDRGGSRAVATLGPEGYSLLFDDVRTPERERPNVTLARAMSDAIVELRDFFGTADPGQWRWGRAHTSTFEDPALGSILSVFNLPSASVTGSAPAGYPRPGALDTVDPANFGRGLPFEPGSGPVMRHVIRLGPGEATFATNVLPGGQNDVQPEAGLFDPVRIDAATHYGDQLPLWLENQTRDQWFALSDVAANAEGRLLFEP